MPKQIKNICNEISSSLTDVYHGVIYKIGEVCEILEKQKLKEVFVILEQ